MLSSRIVSFFCLVLVFYLPFYIHFFTLFLYPYYVSFRLEYCLGIAMHFYKSLPDSTRRIIRTNPPYSDVVRLNNLCNGKYVPMGYTNSCIGENDRIIGGKFNNLRENVYRYFRGKNILIGLIIADFVMMPSVYGYQCYSSIEKELVRILFENYGILSPTFELELPCISFQWIEIEEIVSVSRGYTATVIEFTLGRLVNQTTTNLISIKCNQTGTLHQRVQNG